MDIDLDELQEELEIKGDDAEDTGLLREMAADARTYIKSYRWCPPVANVYFAFGVGGIVGVFLIQFEEAIEGSDDALWVVVGDLPSAYLVVEPGDDGMSALRRYCSMMEEWAYSVLNGNPLDECFPVAAEATQQHGEMLSQRMAFIRTEILESPEE